MLFARTLHPVASAHQHTCVAWGDGGGPHSRLNTALATCQMKSSCFPLLVFFLPPVEDKSALWIHAFGVFWVLDPCAVHSSPACAERALWAVCFLLAKVLIPIMKPSLYSPSCNKTEGPVKLAPNCRTTEWFGLEETFRIIHVHLHWGHAFLHQET